MDAARTAQTYRYERWRAISSGIIETAGSTFLLLIAVRWFHAGAFAKALVAGGGSFGLMLGPWLVAQVDDGENSPRKGTVHASLSNRRLTETEGGQIYSHTNAALIHLLRRRAGSL